MKKIHFGLQRRLTQILAGAASTFALGLSLPAAAAEETAEAEETRGEEASAEELEAEEGNIEAPAAEKVPASPAQSGIHRRGTYSMGTIQGTVNGLDFNRGIISLASGGGNVQLRARPMDIANLNPGDVVALQFANYQGALWVVPEKGADIAPQHFAQFGTLTGTVDQVNKALGTITVRGQTLRAHPEQLEAVIPGQFVSLGYANVSGTNWLAGVQPASGM
ncbi:MAG: hypothetical protein ACO3JL_05995 [Myxococcota bacterium]